MLQQATAININASVQSTVSIDLKLYHRSLHTLLTNSTTLNLIAPPAVSSPTIRPENCTPSNAKIIIYFFSQDLLTQDQKLHSHFHRTITSFVRVHTQILIKINAKEVIQTINFIKTIRNQRNKNSNIIINIKVALPSSTKQTI